jgi:twinkle protein
MPKKKDYTESKEVGKTKCPACPSSDGFAIYDDGHGYCFVCNHYERDIEGKEEDMPLDTVIKSVWCPEVFKQNTGDARGCQERRITKTIAEHYGVRVDYDANRNITAYHYPYYKDNELVAYKTRKLPKQFSTVGDFKDVWPFGCQSFGMGGKRLVITEGEFDAMSVAQASLIHYNKIYPAISIASASNLKSLLQAREWIRSFEEVVLFFDKDAAGQKAIKEAANIIGIDKVKVATSPAKDPCELFIAAGERAVLQAIWDAQPFSPAGIVVGHEPVWEQYLARRSTESVAYPDCLRGINDKTKGMRFGEITLFTSGTGSGKSTVIKEIVLDLLDNTEDKVGMISLEESVGDTAEKFIQMKLKRNLQEYDVSLEEQEEASRAVFGSERLVLLDHQGSVGDESLIDKIEYMALMGCKYLILDHITIAVSEGAEGYTGNEAIDKVMSDLLKITKKHNVWLGVISHLRKVQGGGVTFEQGKLPSMDDIKGSGSIKQISFDIIGFARDMANEDEQIRNTINFIVLKSRFTGKTGPAGNAKYDHDTTRLAWHDKHEIDFEVVQ